MARNSSVRHLSTEKEADALIRRCGARLTRPRSAVLALLLASDRILTHQEITGAVTKTLPVDRVTVYRVLEWLTGQGLAHRIAHDDRIWRFSASSSKAGANSSHAHAHFSCNRCGQTFCLEDSRARLSVKLPPGYRSQQVEVTIRGLCGECS